MTFISLDLRSKEVMGLTLSWVAIRWLLLVADM